MEHKQTKAMKKAIYSEEHQQLVGRLRKARQKAGLTQRQAAELLGATQSYISKVEAGQRRVDIVRLRDFARIYKTDLAYFFS